MTTSADLRRQDFAVGYLDVLPELKDVVRAALVERLGASSVVWENSDGSWPETGVPVPSKFRVYGGSSLSSVISRVRGYPQWEIFAGTVLERRRGGPSVDRRPHSAPSAALLARAAGVPFDAYFLDNLFFRLRGVRWLDLSYVTDLSVILDVDRGTLTLRPMQRKPGPPRLKTSYLGTVVEALPNILSWLAEPDLTFCAKEVGYVDEGQS